MPPATQIVEEDGERRLELQVDGLPAGDGFYEVWLLRPDLEGLQPLGTTDGRGDFIVPDELDLSTYLVVDVSREPLDGNPAHSGQSVLRGELV